MSKYIFTSWCLPIFLAFSLVGENFTIFKTFAYAEDSLSALQRDIIYAKDKHEAIINRVDNTELLTGNDKNSALKNEAQQMLGELEKKGHTILPPAKVTSGKKWPWDPDIKSVVMGDKPVTEIKLEPTAGPAKKEPSWFWRKLGYKEKKPTEGDVLYKVAVSDNQITLKEAIGIAEANSIQMDALKEKVEAAKSKLVEAKRALYPTVQGVWENNGGRVGVADAGDPKNFKPRKYGGGNHKINVSQPLFYGGELQLTVKQAEASVKSAEAELEKSKNELVHQVKTAYYGAVKAEYNLQYQTELYSEIKDIHEKILKGYKEKLFSEIDYLNTESQFQQVYFQVEGAKNDLSSAVLVLQQTVNVPADRNFPVDLHLNFSKIHPDGDEITEIALKNNPDVLMKLYAYESAKCGLQVFQAKKYPHIDLKGSYGMLGEANGDSLESHDGSLDDGDVVKIPSKKEWFVGLQGSMPLGPNSIEYSQVKHQYGPTVLALHGSDDFSHKFTFNLFDKLGDITDEKSAKAAMLQAQSDYEKAKNDVISKIRDDFYNLQKSLIQIDSAAAKMRYQQKQNEVLKYMVGIQETQTQNLLEGLIEMAQSRFSFIQAIADYHLAISGINQTLGDPDYFDTEPK